MPAGRFYRLGRLQNLLAAFHRTWPCANCQFTSAHRDARDVVSAAAGFTLDQGRLPTYIHDRDNGSSGFVARAVGFQLYAEIVLSEY